MQEKAREKNRAAYLKEARMANEEREQVENELNFLTNQDEKFDPVERVVQKRAKTDE